MLNDPWSAFPDAAPSTPGFIPGTGPKPREAPLRTPTQQSTDEVELELKRRELAGKSGPGGALTSEDRGKVTGQLSGAQGLMRRIAEVRGLYEKDFKGGGLGGLVEYAPRSWRPENGLFNDATGALMGDLAAAYGLTAQQQNTPTELEIRFGPYIPKAADRDLQIEGKLRRLYEVAIEKQIDAANRLGTPIDVPAEEFDQRVDDMIRTGVAQDKIEAYWQATGRALTDDNKKQLSDAAAALTAGGGFDVRTDPDAPPSPTSHGWGDGGGALETLWDSAKSNVAGVVEGVAALPDMAAQGMGSLMALPVDAAGFPDAANALRNTPQVHHATESVAPTPQDWPGWLMRKSAGLLGGAYSLPQKTTNSIVDAFAGTAPKRIPMSAATKPGVSVAKAAEAERIPISRPIIDPAARTPMSYLESSLGGGRPVRGSLAATAKAMEERAASLGAKGASQEPGVMGQRIQEAGEAYIKRSGGVARRVYDRAAAAAGNRTAAGRDAVKALDEQIDELSQNANTNRPLIDYLKEIKADFVDDAGQLTPKTVAAIRDMRTGLRGQISARNLTNTDAERRIGIVLDAAKGDIARDLGATAPNAVRLYERGDNLWRARAAEIKQVVQRVIGRKDDKLSGEQVMKRLQAMAAPGGDSARLGRMVAKLDSEDQADYAATVASSLGRRAPDEEFSPAVFLANTRGISDASRRTIFGEDGAQSIANIREVAEAFRDTKAALNNSRSGMVQNWQDAIKGILGLSVPTGAGFIVGGPVGAVAAGAATQGAVMTARRLSANALMKPDVSKWLARAAKANTPSAMRKTMASLPALIARNPQLEQELAPVWQSLAGVANDNVSAISRSAAGTDSNNQQ